MTRLVLAVDRDNDLGEKAGIRSPIVGREANLEAATKLALQDPEDSDTNSVFGAVKLYDEIVEQGRDAEIVTLCGHRNVGSTSDRLIAEQLDTILDKMDATSCIFVTDGAEDEYILPLITSRVRVETVHRVIVRQNADIEGTYYVIKRALEDEKMQRTFLMPLALGLLVYGIFAVSGAAEAGVGAISLTLGTYFLVKVLHLEASVRGIFRDVFEGLRTGKVSLFTSLLSLLIVVGGAIVAANEVLTFSATVTPLQALLVAGQASLWWLVTASLVAASGRALDAYLREGRVLWSYWILPFSVVGLALLLQSAMAIVSNLVTPGNRILTPDIVLDIILAFVIVFIGTATYTYIKENFVEGDEHLDDARAIQDRG